MRVGYKTSGKGKTVFDEVGRMFHISGDTVRKIYYKADLDYLDEEPNYD